MNGCVLDKAELASMRRAIGQMVHPPIDGLKIEQVRLATKDRGVVLIDIPPQKDSLKPFLVVGARTERGVPELGFTYPVREFGTDRWGIKEMHQLIRAGIASLAGAKMASEVAILRGDVERLQADAFPEWLADIVVVAVTNGFRVSQEGDSVSFAVGNWGPVVVQATAAAPPADRVQRQVLLEELAGQGLPVQSNSAGLLELG